MNIAIVTLSPTHLSLRYVLFYHSPYTHTFHRIMTCFWILDQWRNEHDDLLLARSVRGVRVPLITLELF
jgi:hypothetical protein